MKTDIEILFIRFRNELPIIKSKKFLEWVKKQYPDKDLHHLLSSWIGRKLTDLLIIPLNHSEHLKKAQIKKAEYFERYLPQSISILLNYIKHLEAKNEREL